MTKQAGFAVLVATDGSRSALAALATTVRFPWPKGARAHAVLARERSLHGRSPASVSTAIERSEHRVALAARRVLRRRWPDAEVAIVDRPPVQGILAEANRRNARVIVVGSHGQGALSRLILGSVGLGVVRRAPCTVLVVRRRLAKAKRLLLGLDGSAHARAAVDFVAGLTVPGAGAVTLVAVLDPLRPVSTGLLPPSVRAAVGGQLEALEAERRRDAQKEMDRAARRLERAGWTTATQIRMGVPLAELLAATKAARADVLVLGARGVGGLERLLLGSVAEGAVTRSPVPVLLVR